jgi:hypothetical protein
MTTKRSPTHRLALPQAVRAFRRAITPVAGFTRDDFMPGSLYHYTTAAGLEGIIRQRKLRATNFSFMNDPSEVQHGRELVEEVLAERLRKATGIEEIFFQFVVANFNLEMLAEIYVCCFTKLRDDLSQWRAYGASASERYAIGFDSERLEGAASSQPDATFAQVEYEPDKQAQSVNNLLDRAVAFIKQRRHVDNLLSQFGESAASQLAGLVPALKVRAYKPEREWRVVIWARGGVGKPMYDCSRGVLRPYLEFLLSDPLPITSLHVLAPTRRDLALKATTLLLAGVGIDVKPEHSDVPFAE